MFFGKAPLAQPPKLSVIMNLEDRIAGIQKRIDEEHTQRSNDFRGLAQSSVTAARVRSGSRRRAGGGVVHRRAVVTPSGIQFNATGAYPRGRQQGAESRQVIYRTGLIPSSLAAISAIFHGASAE